MDSIADRVKKVRILQELSQKDFAKRLDVTQSVISDIENGHRGVSRNVLLALGIQFNINANWILTGQGEMFMPRQISAFKSAEQTANNVDEALIKNADLLGSEEKKSSSEITSQHIAESNFFKFQYGKTLPLATEESDVNAMVLLPLYNQTAAAGNGQLPTQLDALADYIPIVYEMLGGSNPKDCGIVRVVGDSMTDMGLLDGDLAIFDRTRIEGDGIYVISIGTDVRIKHLEHRPIERKIVISSENEKRYPNPEIISYEQAESLLRVHGKVICWMHRHPY